MQQPACRSPVSISGVVEEVTKEQSCQNGGHDVLNIVDATLASVQIGPGNIISLRAVQRGSLVCRDLLLEIILFCAEQFTEVV